MNKEKLVEVIRVLVKSEMNKTLKPMLKSALKPLLKEMIDQKVNEVLAEKYVQSLSLSQQVIGEQTEQQKPVPVNTKKVSENRRKELLEKLGVDSNPMAQLIYGDVNVNQNIDAAPGVFNPEDDDDEGIDLSQFGL